MDMFSPINKEQNDINLFIEICIKNRFALATFSPSQKQLHVMADDSLCLALSEIQQRTIKLSKCFT